MEEIGKLIVGAGVALVVIGGAIWLLSRIPGLGHLPGDFTIQREGISCFIPLATSILLSILATIVLNLIIRYINK